MKSFTKLLIPFAVCFGLSTISTFAASGKATSCARLYVFGDSYSDIGAGYVDGNGPTAVAYLADRLGLKLLPSTAPNANTGSLDFAVSGAQTGIGAGRIVEGALLGLGMHNQVDDFAARVHSHAITFNPDTTLFFLAGGLNDRNLPSETTVANLQDEIHTLYGLGGRRFMVALLPTAIPAFSEVGKRLNPELSRIPDDLAHNLSGIQITVSHWGPFFDEVMMHPAHYDIEDTTHACAGRAIFHEDASPCTDPQTSYYYHHGHPSTAVHKAVGDMLYNEISGAGAKASGTN
jgi:phospholipase/lecithinase/hemolysin